MQPRTAVLAQLVRDSLYAVDEHSVAGAIVARAQLRAAVPESQLRSADRGPAARSFRRDRSARSFRLARAPGPVHARR